MKLKERRYNQVMHRIKEWLLDSNTELGACISTAEFEKAFTGFDKEEITGTVRYIMRKGYFDPYSKQDEHTYQNVKLTIKGVDEWIFPNGHEDSKKVFLSHATEDKKIAKEIKTELEKNGFVVFLAHENLPGSCEWRDKLISELKTCGIFIALRTKSYISKQYTEQECGFAIALGKRLLPLFIETTSKEAGFCEIFQGGYFKNEEITKITSYCKAQLL